jgi:hypothetical protein
VSACWGAGSSVSAPATTSAAYSPRWRRARPFTSRWAFDVELLGRLLVGEDGTPQLSEADFVEVPLHRWQDVKGSSLSPRHMLTAGKDLLRIAWQIQRRRAS